jgi:small-conductance mechanosensitive channel
MNRFNRLFARLLALTLALVVTLQLPGLAQFPLFPKASPSPSPSPIDVNAQTADVVLDGDTLFQVKVGLGPFTPSARARAINARLVQIAEDSNIPIQSIRVEPKGEEYLVVAGEDTILLISTLSAKDAAAANTTTTNLATSVATKIQQAVADYREARGPRQIATGLGQTILTTFAFLVLLTLFNRFYSKAVDQFQNWVKMHSSNVQLPGRIQASSIAPFIALIVQLFELLRNVLNLVLIGFFTFLVLGFFPWTRSLSRNFWSIIKATFSGVQQAIVGYLPNLFTLILILFITYEVMAFIKLYFREVERGNISIPWLYPDWIRPTFHLVQFFILALAAAIGLPYLPGFNSPAFQGVSLVLSALFTFGAAGAVSNIVGGVIAVYTRGFLLGDMVRVGDMVGIVVDKDLLVTRIRTPKNVLITFPNSTILSSNIVNYSAMARRSGEHTGLVLHTTITLGYDVPWKKVHEALEQAAAVTPNILQDPPPFVLQTSLNDFNVAYELNAFTDRPDLMPVTYSLMHQNIQDKCNEVGIEILSPNYFALRDGNQSTIPETYLPEDYTSPGFRVDPTAVQKNSKSPDSQS